MKDAIAPGPHLALLARELAAPRRTRIADVGANPIIPPPYLAMKEAGHCEIIGFEPQPEAFARLKDMVKDGEQYFPFAVGDGSAEVLHVYAREGYTSVLKPYMKSRIVLGRKPWWQVVEDIPFQTTRLDDIPDLGRIDLLKIDIQGGELAVFRGGRAVLSRAVAVITELRYYPLYQGDPMLGGLDTELRRQGFFYHKPLHAATRSLPHSQAERINPRAMRDQHVDGDAVYLRNLADINRFEDEQVQHLALLAAWVFASHSLVLFALDELVRRALVSADLPGAYVDALPAGLRNTPNP